MLLLKEPLPGKAVTEFVDTRQTWDQSQGPDEQSVDVSMARTGQTSPATRERLLKLLYKFRSLFPKNTKVVKIKHGRKVGLPLIDEDVTPIACKAQRWSPPMADILMKQLNQGLAAGTFRLSTSSWCSRIVPVPKSDGTYRICIDYRDLNKLIKKDSGGLGDITGMLDRMKGSKFFSSLDLAQAYHQLELEETDKHKTAFRDPTGRLLESNRCAFGITTIPAVFSATLGDDLRELLGKGLEKWLDDIALHTKTLEEHFVLLEKVLTILKQKGYTGHFVKSEFLLPELEFLGVMVGRDGTRPAPSKVKAVQEMELPSTVGELRSFLGLANYLRGFVPNFSAIAAPLSDILRNKEFSSKRARNKRVVMGPPQIEAYMKLVEKLTTYPVLVLPNWLEPFTLHTDASLIAAGSVLTQQVENREAPVGYASKRLSRSEEKLSSNDREVLGVLYALEHFKVYLQHRQFTLITDCAALMWLFTSQKLSSKMHRWALKMMAYDMVLKWRKGTDHVVPDALSRLRRKGLGEPDVDTTLPDDGSGEVWGSGPEGPVLEGVPLQRMAQSQLVAAEERRSDAPPDLALLNKDPQEIKLDGICLADLGPTEIDDREEENLSVFYALQITPDVEHYKLLRGCWTWPV
ncbi:unnamed protein product [Ectocarpus sp. CCAP 1310/34]|nr:unnamed protein product [Ectocarpus sp. CCAP 1310/34]